MIVLPQATAALYIKKNTLYDSKRVFVFSLVLLLLVVVSSESCNGEFNGQWI